MNDQIGSFLIVYPFPEGRKLSSNDSYGYLEQIHTVVLLWRFKN
jgi:hypothetical protein